MKSRRFLLLAGGLFALAPAPRRAVDPVAVDAAHVVREVDRRLFGLHVDDPVDRGEARSAGRGLEEALREMAVGSLRYHPRRRPDRALGTGGLALEFDEFIALCRRLGAEPLVVVCHDALRDATGAGAAATRDQLVAAAAGWVRYANLERRYGVRYWEIGSESCLDADGGGATALDYARGLLELSRAMKRADPAILVGASGPCRAEAVGQLDLREGHNVPWWQMVLRASSAAVDFLAVQSNPGAEWRGYRHYQDHEVPLAMAADQALEALRRWAPAEDVRRLRLAIAETDAAGWTGDARADGRTRADDLRSVLVLADMVGSLLSHPAVDRALLWSQRDRSSDGSPSPWAAMDEQHRLRPAGRVLAFWNRFLREQVVGARGSAKVRAYATRSRDGGALSVFLINKDTAWRAVSLEVANGPARPRATRWTLRGGKNDDGPAWTGVGRPRAAGPAWSLALPPASLSVIELVGRSHAPR